MHIAATYQCSHYKCQLHITGQAAGAYIGLVMQFRASQYTVGIDAFHDTRSDQTLLFTLDDTV